MTGKITTKNFSVFSEGKFALIQRLMASGKSFITPFYDGFY